jgi:hypothetical protein
VKFEDSSIGPGQEAEAVSPIAKARDNLKRPTALIRELGDTVPAGIALNLDSGHYTVPDGI